MTTYWDKASLGGKNLEFEILSNDKSNERIRTSAHVPLENDVVTLYITHGSYTYRFRQGDLTGIKNGSPEFLPPSALPEAGKYVPEMINDVMQSCRSETNYRRGELPETIIGVLEHGANIYPCGKEDAA